MCVSYSVQIDAQGDEHYRQFAACCKLAKATKVVTLTVPSAELGTPFNEEVEHLRRLVAIAKLEGVRGRASRVRSGGCPRIPTRSSCCATTWTDWE